MPQGIVTKEFITGISTYLDDREILPKLIDVTNEKPSLVDVMEIFGDSSETTEPEFHYFVNTNLYKLGVISSVSGTPGTSVTVVLTTDTADAAIAGSQAYLPVNGKSVYVYSNASGTLTLQSVDGTNITADDLPVGDYISFPSNSQGEGSDGPAAQRWSKTKFSNVVQSFSSKFQITDIQKVSKITIEVDGQFYYLDIQQIETVMKLRGDISMACIMSQTSGPNFASGSPTVTDADGNPVQFMKGLNQWVEDSGIVNSLNTAGSWTGEDMEDLENDFSAARAHPSYLIYVGSQMNILMDNYLNALNNGSQLSQAGRYSLIDGMDLGITNFSMYSRKYKKVHLPTLDHAQTLNFTNAYNIATSAYFCPMGNILTVDGGSQPYMSLRYMAGNGTDLKYRETLTGALAPTPTNDGKYLAGTYDSVQGLQILGANWFAKVHP